jgi:hypothetical protein
MSDEKPNSEGYPDLMKAIADLDCRIERLELRMEFAHEGIRRLWKTVAVLGNMQDSQELKANERAREIEHQLEVHGEDPWTGSREAF